MSAPLGDGHLLFRSRMADLPRWIDHSKVDSMAMLGAFLGWVATAPAEMQRKVEHLYTIDHAMMTMGTQVLKPKLPTGVDLQSFQCNTANCRRCTSLQGGYQFKWYDARWVVAYNRMKRDGAVSLPMASSSPGGGNGLRNDLPLPQDLVTSTFRRPLLQETEEEEYDENEHHFLQRAIIDEHAASNLNRSACEVEWSRVRASKEFVRPGDG